MQSEQAQQACKMHIFHMHFINADASQLRRAQLKLRVHAAEKLKYEFKVTAVALCPAKMRYAGGVTAM
jgi:hypothetical protein